MTDNSWVDNFLEQSKARQAEMTLSQNDVFGTWEGSKLADNGLVVARGAHAEEVICPIFGDPVPWKSVTVKCTTDQVDEVEYWLGWVHGGDCISMYQELNGYVYIRSDYMCW